SRDVRAPLAAAVRAGRVSPALALRVSHRGIGRCARLPPARWHGTAPHAPRPVDGRSARAGCDPDGRRGIVPERQRGYCGDLDRPCARWRVSGRASRMETGRTVSQPGQAGLFDRDEEETTQAFGPLAARMRPRTL